MNVIPSMAEAITAINDSEKKKVNKMSENLKEYTEKLVQNTEKTEIKTPGIFTNLKKWRGEHGLTTPEAEAYKQVMVKQNLFVMVVSYAVGYIMGRI